MLNREGMIMMTQKDQTKLMVMFKSCLYAVILVMAINVCEARVYTSIGARGAYPDYSCVPGHWENGYWLVGNCGNEIGVNSYPSVYTGPAFIWGGFGGFGGHYTNDEWQSAYSR